MAGGASRRKKSRCFLGKLQLRMLVATVCLMPSKGLIQSYGFLSNANSSNAQRSNVVLQHGTRQVTRISCAISCISSNSCQTFAFQTEKQRCLLNSFAEDNGGDQSFYVRSEWEDRSTALKWISAGLAGIFAIDQNGTLLFHEGSFDHPVYRPGRWQIMSEQVQLEVLDVGRAAVWGTSKTGDIYCKANIVSNQPSGDAWMKVDGWANQTTVRDSDGSVWVINQHGTLFIRKNISSNEPCGTYWMSYNYNVKYASAGFTGLWIVLPNEAVAYGNDAGNLLQVVSDYRYGTVASGHSSVCATTVTGSLLCLDGITPGTTLTGQQWWRDASYMRNFWLATMSSACQVLGISTSDTLLVVNRCLE